MQYEKYLELSLLTNRAHVSESTFYSQTKIIESACGALLQESINKLGDSIVQLAASSELGEIAVEIDGAWNRRGYVSRLGSFAAVLHSKHENLNNKVLWASTKNQGQKREVKGEIRQIIPSTTDGSSHAMESEMFKAFLEWTKQRGIFECINYFIADN